MLMSQLGIEPWPMTAWTCSPRRTCLGNPTKNFQSLLMMSYLPRSMRSSYFTAPPMAGSSLPTTGSYTPSHTSLSSWTKWLQQSWEPCPQVSMKNYLHSQDQVLSPHCRTFYTHTPIYTFNMTGSDKIYTRLDRPDCLPHDPTEYICLGVSTFVQVAPTYVYICGYIWFMSWCICWFYFPVADNHLFSRGKICHATQA